MAILPKLLPAALLGAHTALAGSGDPPPGSNPISWGFYASKETLEPTELEIEGTIPSWLTGSLYRGASGTWDAGNYTSEHWFDGFSRNHRFEIANGQVTYRSRNSSDEVIDFVEETGLYPGGNFGGDPCKLIFGAFEVNYRDGVNPRGDKSSSTVVVSFVPNFVSLDANATYEDDDTAPFHNLVATTDGNELQQINPNTLEPIELFTYQAFNDLLVNGARSAAHPVSSRGGPIFNYVLDLEEEEPTYRVFRIDPTGETSVIANITDAPPAYIHSVFSTENYIIMVIWQADFTHKDRTVLSSLGEWDPERNTLFYIIDRFNGGIVAKYEAPDTFFAFHEANSFEEDNGDIVIDLPVLEDYAFLFNAKLEFLRENVLEYNATSRHDVAGSLTRYRLPYHKPSNCSNGTLTTRPAEKVWSLPFDGANIELPRINPDYKGKSHRYVYGVHVETKGHFIDSIVKIDAQDQTWKVWEPRARSVPSEPIFVKRPGSVNEDDGVLLTVAMDSEQKHSSLVILDAQTMTEIGRAKTPVVVGYGFHGTWGSR